MATNMATNASRPVLKRRMCLGKGSLGKVHKVEWTPESGVTIEAAAKRVPCKEKDWKLLKQDIGSLTKLHHVNIIKYYATILLAPLAFILTEYAVNGSLFNFLKRQRQLPLDLCEKWILNLTHAIKYLRMNHIKGLNVKSPNCLLAGGNVLKVCDYGLMNIHRLCKASKTPSIWWLAPEVLRQESSDNADIFAFGIVLWEMVTCQEPYEGMSTDEVKTEVLNDVRPKIPEDCPPVLSDLMHRCWHGDPDKRPDIDVILKLLRQVYIDTDTMHRMWEFERSFELDEAMSMSDVIAVKPDGELAIVKTVQRLHVYDIDGQYQRSVDINTDRIEPLSKASSSDSSSDSKGSRSRIVVLDSDVEISVHGTDGQHKYNVNMPSGRSYRRSLSRNDILELTEVYSRVDSEDKGTEMVYNYSIVKKNHDKSYRRRVVVNLEGGYILTGDSKVEVIDSEGYPRCEWEPVSPGNRRFDGDSEKLRGMAIDDSGYVLVGVEANPQRYVSKHKDDGFHVSSVYVDISPVHIAPASHDTMVISDGVAKACFVGPRGRHSSNLVPPDTPAHEWRPGGVCCHENIVFISNFTRHRIDCFSAFNGSYLGSPISDLSHPPQGIAMSWEANKLLICTEYEVNVYRCPKDDHEGEQLEKTSMTIDHNGKMFSNQDASLDIPEGALPRDHTVNISIGLGQTYPPLLPDQLVLSPTICCKPDGQNFLKPITLSIPDCFVGITTGYIQVWCKSKRSDWVKLYDGEHDDTRRDDTIVRVESKKVKIRVKHFTLISAVTSSLSSYSSWMTRKCTSCFRTPALKLEILVYMHPRNISAFKNVVMTIYAIRDGITTTKQMVEEQEVRFGGTVCARSNTFLLQPSGHNLQVTIKDTEPTGDWIPNDTMSGIISYAILQQGGTGAHCEIKFHKQDNGSITKFAGALTLHQEGNQNNLSNIHFSDYLSRQSFAEIPDAVPIPDPDFVPVPVPIPDPVHLPYPVPIPDPLPGSLIPTEPGSSHRKSDEIRHPESHVNIYATTRPISLQPGPNQCAMTEPSTPGEPHQISKRPKLVQMVSSTPLCPQNDNPGTTIYGTISTLTTASETPSFRGNSYQNAQSSATNVQAALRPNNSPQQIPSPTCPQGAMSQKNPLQMKLSQEDSHSQHYRPLSTTSQLMFSQSIPPQHEHGSLPPTTPQAMICQSVPPQHSGLRATTPQVMLSQQGVPLRHEPYSPSSITTQVMSSQEGVQSQYGGSSSTASQSRISQEIPFQHDGSSSTASQVRILQDIPFQHGEYGGSLSTGAPLVTINMINLGVPPQYCQRGSYSSVPQVPLSQGIPSHHDQHNQNGSSSTSSQATLFHVSPPDLDRSSSSAPQVTTSQGNPSQYNQYRLSSTAHQSMQSQGIRPQLSGTSPTSPIMPSQQQGVLHPNGGSSSSQDHPHLSAPSVLNASSSNMPSTSASTPPGSTIVQIQPAPPSDPSASLRVMTGPLRDPILEKIARRIQSIWIEFAVSLDFDKTQIDAFTCDSGHDQSLWPVYLMLASFRGRYEDEEADKARDIIVQTMSMHGLSESDAEL